MNSKLKDFLLNKKVQWTLIISFVLIAIALIIYLVTFSMSKKNSETGVVMIETKHNFDLLVREDDQYVGKALRETGVYKEHITNVIKNLIKSGDISIDVGAGYGYHTLVMSKEVGAKGKVYSLEGIPEVYKLLKNSVFMNQAENTKVFNKLIYAENLDLYVVRSPQYFSLTTLFTNEKEANSFGGEVQKMPSLMLDNVLPSLSAVKLLNINMNGAELSVIHGAKNIISRSPKISIIMPWSSTKFAKYGDRALRLIDNFIEAKFEIWLIDSSGSLKLIQKDQLLTLEGADILITKAYIG